MCSTYSFVRDVAFGVLLCGLTFGWSLAGAQAVDPGVRKAAIGTGGPALAVIVAVTGTGVVGLLLTAGLLGHRVAAAVR